MTDLSTPRGASARPTEGWIGSSVPRVEDARLLRGEGCYLPDMVLPGMLHAVVLRSPHAHARIRGIDASAALALPGVHAVYTAADLGPCNSPVPLRLAPIESFLPYRQPPFASDRARYVGEPVALVLADSRYLALDAAERVIADYEPLPAVTEAQAAFQGGPVLHPQAGSNIAARYTVSRGNPDAAFRDAPYVRRERFRCHRHTAAPMETRGLLAAEQDGRLRVWGATKVPWFNRRMLARMLGREETSIDLIELDTGGSFGVRGEFYSEDLLVPWAAHKLGRPVKWVEDRSEHLASTNHAREMEAEVEIAMTREGRILGMRAIVLTDVGAYLRTTGGVAAARAPQFLPGPMRIDDFACEVIAVVTNKTPVGTYRGPGRYEAHFFRERLIDMACAELGLDPVEVRRINLLTAEDMPYQLGKLVPFEAAGEYDTGDYRAGFDQLLDAFGYAEAAKLNGRMVDGWLHGVGLGCFNESSGAGPAEFARVEVLDDGSYLVTSGLTDMGQGQKTVMAQVAAESLGVPFAAIRVQHGSTTLLEEGWGTYHSRGVIMGGTSVKMACDLLLERMAAARARGEPVAGLSALAKFEQTKRSFTYGAHAAHVAVDPETGMVRVLRYMALEDIGRIVNPVLAHGQAIGGVAQGISGTLLDELVYDAHGQLLTGSLMDYAIAYASDLPAIEAITTETARAKLNPLGVKGAGEGATVATGAALANAVANALAPLGVKLTELPLSRSRLHRLVSEARHKADKA